MLMTLALTAGLMTFLFIAMAIGVLMGRKPISGSCGGIATKGCPCGKKAGETCSEEDRPRLEVRS